MRRIFPLLCSLLLIIQLQAQLEVTISDAVQPYCEDGRIEIEVSGGYPPYSYSWTWNDGSGPRQDGRNNRIIDQLRDYEYCVTVTDNYCGTISDCYDVKCCPEIGSIEVRDYCGSDDKGRISISTPHNYSVWVEEKVHGEGIQPPYDYLDPATYLIHFEDVNGCHIIREVEVQDHGLEVEIVDVDNPSCYLSQEDGKIEIDVSSSTNFEIEWYYSINSNPTGAIIGTGPILDNLGPGEYIAVVYNDKCMKLVGEFRLMCCFEQDPDDPTAYVYKCTKLAIPLLVPKSPSSPGLCDGRVEFELVHCTSRSPNPPIVRLFDSNNNLIEDYNALCAGDYQMSIDDGCTTLTREFTITDDCSYWDGVWQVLLNTEVLATGGNCEVDLRLNPLVEVGINQWVSLVGGIAEIDGKTLPIGSNGVTFFNLPVGQHEVNLYMDGCLVATKPIVVLPADFDVKIQTHNGACIGGGIIWAYGQVEVVVEGACCEVDQILWDNNSTSMTRTGMLPDQMYEFRLELTCGIIINGRVQVSNTFNPRNLDPEVCIMDAECINRDAIYGLVDLDGTFVHGGSSEIDLPLFQLTGINPQVHGDDWIELSRVTRYHQVTLTGTKSTWASHVDPEEKFCIIYESCVFGDIHYAGGGFERVDFVCEEFIRRDGDEYCAAICGCDYDEPVFLQDGTLYQPEERIVPCCNPSDFELFQEGEEWFPHFHNLCELLLQYTTEDPMLPDEFCSLRYYCPEGSTIDGYHVLRGEVTSTITTREGDDQCLVYHIQCLYPNGQQKSLTVEPSHYRGDTECEEEFCQEGFTGRAGGKISNGLGSLFPNPSNGMIKYRHSLEIAESVNLQIYSIRGDVVLERHYKSLSAEEEIDLTGLPDGVYYLSSQNESGIEILPFIISKD